jgi:hypothetical protein
MGFLRRLLKTPDEDEDEGRDEFAAEESGLLMVPSIPGEQAEPATAEGAATEPQVPVAAPVPAEDAPTQPVASGADPLDLADPSSAVQGQPEPAPGQGPQPEQDPSDEAMNLFRAAAVRESSLSSVLKEGIEDVSITDLLAEARSIRDDLSGRQSGAGARQQEAA